MGIRIKELMVEHGYTQQRLEAAIGASRGYLSRIVSGSRGQKISPEYLTSIASVLMTTPNYLRWGTEIEEGAIMTPSAGLSPRLDEIPGYREAEFAAIRNNPNIAFSIFESARQARFNPAPEQITEKYLSELVNFLSNNTAMIDETDQVRSTLDKSGRTKTVPRSRQ